MPKTEKDEWKNKVLGWLVPLIFILVSTIYTVTWIKTDRQVQINTKHSNEMARVQAAHVEKLEGLKETSEEIKEGINDLKTLIIEE